MHGIQSHSGWFEYTSRRLAEAGIAAWFLDRRGSGLNGRDRGHLPHYERALDDVIECLELVRRGSDEVGAPAAVVLLGLSWGGRLAAVLAARRPELLDGLALLYPGICSRVRPAWHERLQLRLAEWAGVRKKLVRVPLDDPCLFTAEPEWQDFIRDDPLAVRVVTTSFLFASQQLEDLARSAPPQIRIPSLLMLSGQDRIIDAAQTRDWFQRLGTTDRTLIEYPAAYHTLEFEPDRARYVDDLIQWIQSVRLREVVAEPRPFVA